MDTKLRAAAPVKSLLETFKSTGYLQLSFSIYLLSQSAWQSCYKSYMGFILSNISQINCLLYFTRFGSIYDMYRGEGVLISVFIYFSSLEFDLNIKSGYCPKNLVRF